MKAALASCVAVVAVVVFALMAASAGGMTRVIGESTGTMTPAGLAAYGGTYAAMAQQYQPAQGMTAAGVRAYGDTYQSMAVSYLAADQQTGIPVQWHDVFTGVGVMLGVVLLVGTGVYEMRSHRHRHYGRPTLAH